MKTWSLVSLFGALTIWPRASRRTDAKGSEHEEDDVSRNRWRKQLPLVLLLSGGLVVAASEASSSDSRVRVTIVPQPSGRSAPPSKALVRQYLEGRARIAAKNNQAAAAASAAAVEADLHRGGVHAQVPVDVVREVASTQRNIRNTVAQTQSIILAEPAAAKDDNEVLYMGNTYISRSSDWASWTPESIPAGPSFATQACCDPQVVYHSGQDTTFASFLYVNSLQELTDGAVQIFIRQGTIADGNDCVAVVDPGGTTIIPDYPHLGVSDNFLYLTINNIDTKGTATRDDNTWINSQVLRINVSDMANCVASPRFNTFTFPGPNQSADQRVFVPVENATTTMYWGALATPTIFRIYRWREEDVSASQVSEIVRDGLDASNFNDPDCRGGTGDLDWTLGAVDTLGFSLRGAVGGGQLIFLWNVGADESHSQGHIHAVAFRESDLAVIAQPHVFDNDTCTGYPVVGANSQGDFGLSQVAGGRSGGLAGDEPCSSEATCAARGYISVDDEDTDGIFFAFRSLTAEGTHNPPIDERFGDYFTMRKNENCPLTWVATNYSLLNGNTSPPHVNARYIEFGSSREPACP